MKKGLLLIVGIIIIAVGIYYTYYQNKEEGFTSQRTYLDRQHGFSFQYPANWSICKNSSDLFIYASVSDNCTLIESNPNDPSVRFLLVRSIGDLDRGFLEAGTLKEDTGWQNYKQHLNGLVG